MQNKTHFAKSFLAAFEGSNFIHSVYETNDIIEDIFCFWTWWTNLYWSWGNKYNINKEEQEKRNKEKKEEKASR